MRNRLVLIHFAIFAIGTVSSCTRFGKDKAENENPPVDYANALNIDVRTISFERNGLYLNGKEYYAFGISGYSRLRANDSVYRLSDIAPPFTLRKNKGTDTLELTKDGKRFVLNITEEIRRSQTEKD